MRIIMKSKMNVCMAAKPREAYIIYVDKNGIESEPRLIGKKAPDSCQFCGKDWNEH